MKPQSAENDIKEIKSSGLFSLPAAFLKKLYANTEQFLDKQEEKKHLDAKAHEQLEYQGEIVDLSKSLNALIEHAQLIFKNRQAFDSVKKLADGISDNSDSNHVLMAFIGVLKNISDKYFVEKQELVFELPLTILKKFKFSKDYQDKSTALQVNCKKIKSITDLNVCLHDVYDLFYSVYQDAYADKEELEKFLFNIGAQISRIGDKLHTVAEEQVSDFKIQGDLNLKMSDAVSLISKSIISGNDLHSLKKSVKVQLDALQNIVEEERQIVKAQESRVQKSVKVLANRVNELTLEAKELREKVQREREHAVRDPLTGLYNRQAYNKKISGFISSKEEYSGNLSLLVWDIDHFKQFNDQYGHMVGDKVLSTVAEKLTKSLKSNYFLARYGGEEFVMILPKLSIHDAQVFADYVRNEISNIAFIVKGKKITITVSCGITILKNSDSVQSIFERADKALYTAKKSGRNRVEVYI